MQEAGVIFGGAERSGLEAVSTVSHQKARQMASRTGERSRHGGEGRQPRLTFHKRLARARYAESAGVIFGGAERSGLEAVSTVSHQKAHQMASRTGERSRHGGKGRQPRLTFHKRLARARYAESAGVIFGGAERRGLEAVSTVSHQKARQMASRTGE